MVNRVNFGLLQIKQPELKKNASDLDKQQITQKFEDNLSTLKQGISETYDYDSISLGDGRLTFHFIRATTGDLKHRDYFDFDLFHKAGDLGLDSRIVRNNDEFIEMGR